MSDKIEAQAEAVEWEPSLKTPPKTEMSRGAQTAWIVGAIALAFGGYLEYQRKEALDVSYPGCWSLIHSPAEDDCKVAIAVRQLRGLSN